MVVNLQISSLKTLWIKTMSSLDKALEGFAMFALNQGEICTCPSRALVQESIADKFLEMAVERVKRIKTVTRSIQKR